MTETIEELKERIRVLTLLQEGHLKYGENGKCYCSFCGKEQHEVKKLIAGPAVMICDECVDLCLDIIYTEKSRDDEKAANVPRETIQAEPETTPAQRITVDQLLGFNDTEFLRVLRDMLDARLPENQSP